jgi:hypothetical protein
MAEIIWKYYCALTASHAKLRGRELKKKQEALLTKSLDATTAKQEDSMDPGHILHMIRSELTDNKIDLFDGIVEEIYKKSFE